MWQTVCRMCKWNSGEAYLKSVAEAIGKVHEEDHKGHKVATEKVSTLGRGLDGKHETKHRRPGSPRS